MFTLKETDDEQRYEIYLDGEVCQNAYAYERKSVEQNYEIISKSKIDSKKISKYSLTEIPPFIHLNLSDLFDWLKFKHALSLTFDLKKDKLNKNAKTDYLEICFSIYPNLKKWRENYSYTEYEETFRQNWESKGIFNSKIEFYTEDYPSIYIVFPNLIYASSSIIEFVSKYEEIVKEIHKSTLKILSSSSNEITVNEIFEFPEKISFACKQYLAYFAQFLKDLGIEADSNLTEEAGKVLFSVTPTDDIEALDKIREALALYLTLPSSPIVYDESFKAMRLEQQIRNLEHSQKMAETEIRSTQYAFRLAQQSIENQDRIIAQQSALLDQQNRIIEKITSKSVMIDSLENKEEVFEGLKVGESEFLAKQVGVHFNPVTFVKTIGKKILGKEEIISILDSDEETDKK